MIKRFLQGIAFAGAFFAAGCVSLLPETSPAKPRYHIASADLSSAPSTSFSWSLAVATPGTTRAYDTTKIAVSPNAGKIEYYAKAEWADRAPKLFQTALIQTFEDSGRILNVGDRPALLLPNFVLQTDIRKLQIRVDGSKQTPEVSIYARLTDGNGKVYAAKRFIGEEKPKSRSEDDVIAAFNIALTSVIKDIANWSFEQAALTTPQEPAAS